MTVKIIGIRTAPRRTRKTRQAESHLANKRLRRLPLSKFPVPAFMPFTKNGYKKTVYQTIIENAA